MTWLDRVLATPTIGFHFEPKLYTDHDYLSNLRPLFDRWYRDWDVNISDQGPLQTAIQVSSGFSYTIRPGSFVVQFRYEHELKGQPGLRPEIQYRNQLEKYSVLLQRTIDEFCELTGHLIGEGSRFLTMIGIVATTSLNAESPPPGVGAFLGHLERPWGRSLLKYQTDLVSILNETSTIREQCHHRIYLDQGDEARKNHIRLILDWQRVLVSPIELRANKIKDHLQSGIVSALDYFERFAKGELQYDHVN